MNGHTPGIALLAALLAVLTLASSACAECAWVLWIHAKEEVGDRTNRSQWEVIQAVKSEPLCSTALREKMKAEKSEDVVSNNTVRLRRGTTTLTFRYLCLPDTVDPRGPKTSGR